MFVPGPLDRVIHSCPVCGDEAAGLSGYCRRCDLADLGSFEAQMLRLHGGDLRKEPLPAGAEVTL